VVCVQVESLKAARAEAKGHAYREYALDKQLAFVSDASNIAFEELELPHLIQVEGQGCHEGSGDGLGNGCFTHNTVTALCTLGADGVGDGSLHVHRVVRGPGGAVGRAPLCASRKNTLGSCEQSWDVGLQRRSCPGWV
jgi:hypothetical protein